MAYHNGQPFSTYDKDQDQSETLNCAFRYGGGWWYNACHRSNLNGLYLVGPFQNFGDGVIWFPWTGWYFSLKYVDMKIRRRMPRL